MIFMRKSGILAAISSLPSPYGIGTLGKAAFRFVDFLSDTNQYYWQILPINPPGYGNSPYQSHSAFAGNPYFIDLELLKEAGLLLENEIPAFYSANNEKVDYAFLFNTRMDVLFKAASRVDTSSFEYRHFLLENSFWLPDYCRYMELKQLNSMKALSQWTVTTPPLESSLAKTYEKIQFLFFRQWGRLKDYANSKNVHLIGDLPIYVSHDSADFYSDPKLFLTDENGKPTRVAGCPPDEYSQNGQLWGNPIYDWDEMKKDGFSWWKERFSQAEKLFDVVRIDHFRGFYEYYSVKAEEQTALFGEWRKGPGMEFVNMLRESFPSLGIIAEDLGFLTDDTKRFFKESGFPGMKILQFAFDESDSDYLPFKHEKNSVVYTGTHDNPTIVGWQCTANPESVVRAMDYFGTQNPSSLADSFIRAAFSSLCDTAIIPLQDWFKKGSLSRMNTPSTVKNNWEYRFSEEELTERLGAKIRNFTKIYSR